MTTKLVKWASNDGQIIKSGLSDGYGGKAITTAAHLDYDRHGFEGYPGNVGFSAAIWERTLTLTAKHQVLSATDLHGRVQATVAALQKSLPDGYRIELGGELENAGEANAALLDNMPIALVAILLLLVWQFNSLRRTAIIALTIPLSLIGAILGLLVMQASFGFTSLLGILSLAGIIINNAIVLIDRVELEREEGASAWDAILNAGVRRLRPILITTLTTVLGLLPLLLFGGALWHGMAVVIMFGLGVGTVLTLGVVPALYAIMFRVRAPDKTAAPEPPTETGEMPA